MHWSFDLRWLFLLLFSLWLMPTHALAALSVSGHGLLSAENVEVSSRGHKGIVVVFLSAQCPCSDSHASELADLSREFTDYAFVGVHSNPEEKKAQTIDYFKKIALPFPLIQDSDEKLAEQFKALKTPHVFVIAADGQIVYRGGVSSSRDFSRAEHKYLREALSDLHAGRKVRTPESRTLGCMITHGEPCDW